MARPSMAAQRKEEILDALEQCILNYGIQATSLENIAEKANVKRTILRHYIGNRDQIICALGERWTAIYSQQWQELLAILPQKNRSEALIDSLFTVRSKEMIESTIIGEAIFSEAKRLAPLKAQQQQIIDEFIVHLTRELCHDFPDANKESVELVAHGIYANYLMCESLLPLQLFDDIHKLKLSSKLFCTVLKNK